jgi:type VI secretion system secreted protein Hcp
MAFDSFLLIDGIPGESTDAAHGEWIELLSFSFGGSQPTSGSISSGGGRTSGRVDLGPLTAAKPLDKASPKLFQACCNGTHIPSITLEVCRSDGSKVLYYKVELEDSTVSDYQMVGAAKGDGATPLPVDQISFNYAKITVTYTETDHKTGAPKGDVAMFWNQHDNLGG